MRAKWNLICYSFTLFELHAHKGGRERERERGRGDLSFRYSLGYILRRLEALFIVKEQEGADKKKKLKGYSFVHDSFETVSTCTSTIKLRSLFLGVDQT